MLLSEAKILIIDDDVDVLSAAKLLLKRHAKAVDIEKNPQKLPFLVTNGDYNLILLDMNLPSGSGLDLVRELRELRGPALPPNVALTAHAMRGDRERFLAAGCDDYISKPIEARSFLDAVERSLARPPEPLGGGQFR